MTKLRNIHFSESERRKAKSKGPSAAMLVITVIVSAIAALSASFLTSNGDADFMRIARNIAGEDATIRRGDWPAESVGAKLPRPKTRAKPVKGSAFRE